MIKNTYLFKANDLVYEMNGITTMKQLFIGSVIAILTIFVTLSAGETGNNMMTTGSSINNNYNEMLYYQGINVRNNMFDFNNNDGDPNFDILSRKRKDISRMEPSNLQIVDDYKYDTMEERVLFKSTLWYKYLGLQKVGKIWPRLPERILKGEKRKYSILTNEVEKLENLLVKVKFLYKDFFTTFHTVTETAISSYFELLNDYTKNLKVEQKKNENLIQDYKKQSVETKKRYNLVYGKLLRKDNLINQVLKISNDMRVSLKLLQKSFALG